MTQILALITRDYAMLAADRLLTWNGGPNHGKVYRDEECKVVCIGNLAGIGYTGLARLQGRPAHEWIGVTLAKANSRRPKDAVDALMAQAPTAVQSVPPHLRALTFLIAGWDWFGNPPLLRPHIAVISNVIDDKGQMVAAPSRVFTAHLLLLKENQNLAGHVVGQPLAPERATDLNRNLRRLAERSIGPKEALRYLVDEIQFTSRSAATVGDRVLGMCIPLTSVQDMLRTGHSMMIASQPSVEAPTFAYFDPTMDESHQFGPTYVHGQMAMTDVETESRPEDNNFQSSSMRILHMPSKPSE